VCVLRRKQQHHTHNKVRGNGGVQNAQAFQGIPAELVEEVLTTTSPYM